MTIPPTSLKQADFKDAYTVQTPIGYTYFNVFTHSMSPRGDHGEDEGEGGGSLR